MSLLILVCVGSGLSIISDGLSPVSVAMLLCESDELARGEGEGEGLDGGGGEKAEAAR